VQLFGGTEISLDGAPLDVSSRLAYKGMMLEGVPNAAMAVGYSNASWTLKTELTCDYVARLLNHMRERGARVAAPMNGDGQAAGGSVFGLQSGYLLRVADRLPKEGTKFPWQVHHNYIRDYQVMKRGAIDDGTMVFSSPDP
jgi:cation diffusion facilitator CzcD-associated flavoprotein CzcO